MEKKYTIAVAGTGYVVKKWEGATTLVVGVDIGSQWHYARAFDWRGIEITKKAFRFSNDLDGYTAFEKWVRETAKNSAKMEVLIGCEPTGHYWYTFARYVGLHGMKLAFVNPYHVKQSKEMDDNSPRKTDEKDPKTIAKLVTEGRYSFPYLPEGIYAELREAVSVRDQIVKAMNAAANRIQRWLTIYFPEYLKVYKVFDSVSGLTMLWQAPLPEDVVKLGADGIVALWHEKKLRAVGKKRAQTLIEAAKSSSPKQIQKLAGLEPKENSSGKHKGRTSISKRGRRKLRRLLFQAVLPLIRSNEDFREVYTYYSTRKDNPLKGTQAVIAVGCKLIRIFYVLLSHGADYSSTRFRADILRPGQAKAA